MRAVLAIAVVAITGLAAPSALACRREVSQPSPVANWPLAALDQAMSGEVAVDVEFVRFINLVSIDDPDRIVVTTCDPPEVLVRIVRVVSGDVGGQQFLALPGSAVPEEWTDPITFVGKLSSTPSTRKFAGYVPDIDPAVPRLVPRMPPK